MVFVEESTATAYREAWETWSKQLAHLHRVFLDGEPIKPDQIKGLLNREARAKEKYDDARLHLLGLGAGATTAPQVDANPFR